MTNKAIIFDLDGTLIDSIMDIALCTNQVLKEFDLPIHPLDDYKYFVGGGASVLINSALPKNYTKELYESVLERFKKVYDNEQHHNTKPYNGIYELLVELKRREIKIGVLSNKPHYFTCKYVEEFFNDLNLDEIHGQKENIPKKPDPIAAINIAKSFEIEPKNIYFVGDSDVDMKTAHNSGMVAVGVKWGFRGPKELLDNGAKFIANEPRDILKLFE